MSFWGQVWRFVTFYKLRKTLGMARAADRQFTGSTGGIRDAFDIHRETLITNYNELLDAVSQLEVVLEERRIELENLNTEEEELVGMREGALTAIEAAQASGDAEELAKHKEAFNRFQTRIDEIEARQKALTTDIEEQRKRSSGFERQLTAMQAEVQKLPAQKAEAIADFVSAQKVIELNQRLQGLQSNVDRGPIDAVLQANRELTAKARVSQRIAGTDVKAQDAEYAATGRATSADKQMAAMLAARKAEREGKTGEATVAGKTERKEF